MVLRRIGPLSAGKVTAVLYALLGLFIGACMTLLSVLGGSPSGEADAMGSYSAMFGIAAILIIPIMLSIVSFISGIISAFIFNIATKLGGGIDVDLS